MAEGTTIAGGPGHQPPPGKLAWGKSRRLCGRGVFRRIMDDGVRQSAGPLLGFAVAGEQPQTRIGLSVGKRVGNAVRRNRQRRLVREVLRAGQHAWTTPMDVVIVVRPHQILSSAEYRPLIERLIDGLAGGLARRKTAAKPGG